MMAKKTVDAENMPLREALQPVIEVLKQLGGQFTFTDEEGTTYIIARADMMGSQSSQAETQLSLPTRQSFSGYSKAFAELSGEGSSPSFSMRTTADELLEKINREIALFQLQQVEAEVDDLSVDAPEAPTADTGEGILSMPDRPPLKVRFEPIKGDLPPELQE
jgi:hypothetical protein